MSLIVSGNIFSAVLLHAQTAEATRVHATSSTAYVASDPLGSVDRIRKVAAHASRSEWRHDLRRHQLPRVTCWNGKVVVEHPHVQDCPDAPKPASPPAYSSAGVPAIWVALMECEAGSSGKWAAATGNGFYGGLQFTLGTWQAYGGTGMPNSASPATQVAVGRKVLAAQGVGAWPVCGPRVGLYPGA